MIKRVQSLLKKYNLAPLKFLSQHFLISRRVIKKMASYAKKTTLEIGPGLGFITEELAHNAEKVIAVEKDRGMVEVLRKEYTFDNVELHNEDFLETSYSFDCCVSSIPYSLSTEIIFRLLDTDHEYSVLLLQKEYTEKIAEMDSRLGVMVHAFADIEILDTVDRQCFYPSPKVDSVIAMFTPHKKVTAPFFSDTVRVLFQHKRKKVINSLSDSAHALNIDKKNIKKILSDIPYREKRVFNLTLEEIEEISYALKDNTKNMNQENSV